MRYVAGDAPIEENADVRKACARSLSPLDAVEDGCNVLMGNLVHGVLPVEVAAKAPLKHGLGARAPSVLCQEGVECIREAGGRAWLEGGFLERS